MHGRCRFADHGFGFGGTGRDRHPTRRCRLRPAVADESHESGTAESGTAATVSYARQVADGNADFTASHDAYMREAYRDPWDVQPTNCPATGDPLTGVYGRTYAEDGWLLMQAAGDMFGPATGHTPILLFAITSASGAPLAHSPMGGARLTHIDTIDTWHGALAAMRWHIDQASAVAARQLSGLTRLAERMSGPPERRAAPGHTGVRDMCPGMSEFGRGAT
jgi:hypothetical protein